MSDNIGFNATDDVSGLQFQRVKLVSSELDHADPIPSNGVTGLYVDIRNIVPGASIGSSPAQAAGAAVTSVSGLAASATILASNASRKGALFFNDATANMYLKLGATASTSSFTVMLQQNEYYELPSPIYIGAVDAIWASAFTGNVRVTELT